jgi:outer membrane biosynthesis protein TonB
MPTSETPIRLFEPEPVTEAEGPAEPTARAEAEKLAPSESSSPAVRGSRWIDYDTHELLEMISELEDERRWARLREGVLWAFLVHLLLLAALWWVPKYVFKAPPVISSNNKEPFTYLDTPFVAPPKPVKPLLRQPQIDRKTLEDLKRDTAPPAPAAAPPPQPAPPVVQPQPQPVLPPNPQSQSQVEAPRPSTNPRPDFRAMNQQLSPADQLRKDMLDAARSHGSGNAGNLGSGGGLRMHPGAGTGGLDILSDQQGVDFSNWIQRWHYETQRTWDPLIPDEVNPPLNKSGMVAIRFKVLPNGRLMEGSLVLEGRSGDTALDRAAWGALTGSNWPPLPREFHGPYLELRAWFLYNIEPGK